MRSEDANKESEWRDSVKKGLSSAVVEGNFDILSDLARRPDCDLTFARPDKKNLQDSSDGFHDSFGETATDADDLPGNSEPGEFANRLAKSVHSQPMPERL